jgi:hypothetical protein
MVGEIKNVIRKESNIVLQSQKKNDQNLESMRNIVQEQNKKMDEFNMKIDNKLDIIVSSFK